MNLRLKRFASLALTIFTLFLAAGGVFAEAESLRPNFVVGDGKNGNTYARWTESIKDLPIESVTATVRRLKGSSNTYLNLRFKDGLTFDNGKRIYLNDNRSRTVGWNGGGQRSGGRPLIMMAYDGEVLLEAIEIRYAGADSDPATPPRPNGSIVGGGIGAGGSIVTPPRPGSSDSDAELRCRGIRTRQPRIEIGRIRPVGGLFSGKYRIEGSIYGQCIGEVGYFENGRLKEQIDFPLDDRFQRSEFEIKVQAGRGGELRAYTTDGREEFVEIDDQLSDAGPNY